MRLVLLGGGGHASDILSALDLIQSQGGQRVIAGFVADGEVDMRRFRHRGISRIGVLDDLPRLDVSHFLAADAYPAERRRLVWLAEGGGLKPFSLIHPTALVPPDVLVREGAVILARACISPGAMIGAHALISQMAIVGHDCRVGDFASVMPGAAAGGDANLGEGCLIGANAAVLERRQVGAWAKVGAGAVVTRNVPGGVTAVGVPARWPPVPRLTPGMIPARPPHRPPRG